MGYVEGPDNGLRWHADGTLWYHPELDMQEGEARAYMREAIASIPPEFREVEP
jgi:hypothetical protein